MAQEVITSPKFIIRSKTDSQKFTVDKKVIDSSILLKNICDITEITDPILIDCSGESLEFFIKLINNYYQTLEENESDIEFETNLYHSFTPTKEKLIKLIQDLCLLDSDIFLDSVADYILAILKDMDWIDMQKYLGLENDFTEDERECIENWEKCEYFLSLDTDILKFPFANKNLYSLKTDFATPLNVLIARIIQRSNEKISYVLSMINKTIKNEVDRYHFKLSDFDGSEICCTLRVSGRDIKKGFTFRLKGEELDERYFNALKKRKIITAECSATFDEADGELIKINSLDFVNSKKIEIGFGSSFNSIYRFDVKKCQIPSIYYDFPTLKEKEIKFEDFYNHLIKKDLSKKIKITTFDIFKFFSPQCKLWFYKKANASKFYTVTIRPFMCQYPIDIYPEFKTFFCNYMEDDGIIVSHVPILGIPLDETDDLCSHKYPEYSVSVFKKYWDNIVAN